MVYRCLIIPHLLFIPHLLASAQRDNGHAVVSYFDLDYLLSNIRTIQVDFLGNLTKGLNYRGKYALFLVRQEVYGNTVLTQPQRFHTYNDKMSQIIVSSSVSRALRLAFALRF